MNMTYQDFDEFVNMCCNKHKSGEITVRQFGYPEVFVKRELETSRDDEPIPIVSKIEFSTENSFIEIHYPQREHWEGEHKKVVMINAILRELECAGKQEEEPGPTASGLVRIALGLEPDRMLHNLRDLETLFKTERIKGVAKQLAEAYDFPKDPGLGVFYTKNKESGKEWIGLDFAKKGEPDAWIPLPVTALNGIHKQILALKERMTRKDE